MFCTQCGSEIPDNAQFCTFCGAQFEKLIPRQIQPTQPIAPIEPVPPSQTTPIPPSVPSRGKSKVGAAITIVLIIGLIFFITGLSPVYSGSNSGTTLLVIGVIMLLCIGSSVCGSRGRGGGGWACCVYSGCSDCDCGGCDCDC